MSQTVQIKNHLNSGNSITPLEAFEQFGCMRLAARIRDLRQSGMEIVSLPFQTKSGKIVARYMEVKK